MVSERTIQRGWEKGRLYLHHALDDSAPSMNRFPVWQLPA
jgi:hypothetical protein